MKFELSKVKELIYNSQVYLNTGDEFLDKRYLDHYNEFGHPMNYYRLFYHLSAKFKPEFVVELGAWQGTAAAHFAGGNEQTKVITIDHHKDPGDELNKEKMVEALYEYSNLKYYQGWTWDVFGDIKQLHKKIDILFIDSWHHYDYAKKDWDMYSQLLSQEALVICDDIMHDQPTTIVGMERFWNELKGDKFLHSFKGRENIPMGFLKWRN